MAPFYMVNVNSWIKKRKRLKMVKLMPDKWEAEVYSQHNMGLYGQRVCFKCPLRK